MAIPYYPDDVSGKDICYMEGYINGTHFGNAFMLYPSAFILGFMTSNLWRKTYE